MQKKLLAAISALALVGCATEPKPLTIEDRKAFSKFLSDNLTAGQVKPAEPITLYEAMARALKYNLDHRVKMMEASLAKRDFTLARYDVLPQLVANSGYYSRDNDPGASSLSLLSGQQSLEPSTSSERQLFTTDLTASWNVLDFGLSYIRAQQLGDEALIYQERQRKAINEIMEDVRITYWRAASAERLSRELAAIQADVNDAYEKSRRLYKNRKTSPLSALAYQRELNEILDEAQRLQHELTLEKKRLAQLMNLPAGQDFSIVLPDRKQAPAIFGLPLGEAIRVALDNRPEVREAAYRIRMGDRDLTKALLEALPGVELYGAFNYDTNDFLFNNDWAAWGARASWNVIRVFETPKRRQRAKAQIMLERQRALATAMAVSSQVHVSIVRYAAMQRSLETAKRSHHVQREILSQIKASADARNTSYQTLIRERMNMIVAEARYDIAYADVQDAYAGVHAAMGADPFGSDITGAEDISTLTKSLRKLWMTREGKETAGEQAVYSLKYSSKS